MVNGMTPKELSKILEEDGLDECLLKLHCLSKKHQVQVRHLILDFAERALKFARDDEQCLKLAIETARLCLDGKVGKDKPREIVNGAYRHTYAAAAAADAGVAKSGSVGWAYAADAVYYSTYHAAAMYSAAAIYSTANASAAERRHQKGRLKGLLKSMDRGDCGSI